MSTEVKEYHVFIYGSPAGFQTNRSQIVLYDNSDGIAAYVRFNDPDMDFEDDSETGGVINMHLPSTMFQSVLDVLRNEGPVFVYFAQGRGFLTTSREPVGEGES